MTEVVTFRNLAKSDSRHQNIPIPRYAPKEKVIKLQDNVSHPMITDNQSQNVSCKQFKAISYGDERYSCRMQNSNAAGSTCPSVPSCSNTQFRMPNNVFIQEKIMEHPSYPGTSVDIAPRAPISRDVPQNASRNFNVEMGQLRTEQFQKLNVQEVSTPHYEGSKNSGMYIKPRLPRLQPLQPSSEVTAQLNAAQPTAQDESKVLWRNLSQYKSDPSMYEPRTQYRDIRLEKRKERQLAYQKRQDEKKTRMEAMMNVYLQNKQQGIHEDLANGYQCQTIQQPPIQTVLGCENGACTYTPKRVTFQNC